MKVRFAIQSYNDRKELIALFGLNGYPAIEVKHEDGFMMSTTYFVEVDIPMTDSCKFANRVLERTMDEFPEGEEQLK